MRLTNELYGRGAARTRTFVTDEHVFCAMEGVLTAVERTLVEAGETELVRELRTRFMQMVRPVFAAEVFVLGDGHAPEPAAAAGEIAEANGL